jgi:hypothetical protein
MFFVLQGDSVVSEFLMFLAVVGGSLGNMNKKFYRTCELVSNLNISVIAAALSF